MDKQFDELSKSLADDVSRREALRRIGKGLAVIAVGTILTLLDARKAEAAITCKTNADCGPNSYCCYCPHPSRHRAPYSYCIGMDELEINNCHYQCSGY